MKKSLLLMAMCLVCIDTYAQDDDVYFVPSSEDNTENSDTYIAPKRSTYTPITSSEDETYEQSNWANGRGNCGRDIDEYNRRGKNYNSSVQSDTSITNGAQRIYDEGYDDGYEDGMYTSRIVRFYSPRAGVYVSSPYYLDYYDFYYDPWYYGYASPWPWTWSGWYGWGSWYGWRPWHSSWYWGWNDPWYHDYCFGWGGHGWRPEHWIPANAERGPVGGWVAYGGRRGSGQAVATASAHRSSYSSRPSSRLGFNSSQSTGTRSTYSGKGNYRPSRSFGNSSRSVNGNSTNRSTTRSSQSSERSSRSFSNSNSSQRSSSSSRSFSSPSRSSGFSGGRSGGFSGGGHSGGGGRSFGGRR